MWVKSSSKRRCGTCDVVVERWVLHNNLGHSVGEAAFCPMCYPDVERIFHTDEAAFELKARSEAEEVKIPVVL